MLRENVFMSLLLIMQKKKMLRLVSIGMLDE